MNCKPGDLAVVHSCDWTVELNNHFVIVIRIANSNEWTPLPNQNTVMTAWMCKSASGGELPVRQIDGVFRWVAERPIGDQYLRPIRDPGDDAVDETLHWLPVPSQHKEVA